MKFLVKYLIDGSPNVYVFDDRDEAVNYINAVNSKNDEDITAIDNNGFDRYTITFRGGIKVYVSIETRPDDKVRYDLDYIKNGRHIETRRFTKRYLAVNFANKILDELDAVAGENEDEYGEWILDDRSRNLKVLLKLSVVVLDDKKQDSDYEILGVKTNATEDEIKKAYRTLSKKYHPDLGGNEKQFEKIQMAYERIKDGRGSKKKQSVEEQYHSVDMRAFFNEVKKGFDKNKAAKRSAVREEASKSFVESLFGAPFFGILAVVANNAGNTILGAFFVIVTISYLVKFVGSIVDLIQPDGKIY